MQTPLIRLFRAALVCALVLGLAGTASADRKAEAKAKAFYLEGQKAFDLGDFPRAIDNFKKAYDAAPKPGLLFNIAQAYRLSDDARQALFFYQNYLRLLPDAANRADVEDWIAKLEARLASGTGPSPSPSPGPGTNPDDPIGSDEPLLPPDLTPGDGTKIPSPVSVAEGTDPGAAPVQAPSDDEGSPPIYKRWWFWTGVGVVVVGATVLALMAGSSDEVSYPSTHFPTVEAFQ